VDRPITLHLKSSQAGKMLSGILCSFWEPLLILSLELNIFNIIQRIIHLFFDCRGNNCAHFFKFPEDVGIDIL
jgi:hypothetical protein